MLFSLLDELDVNTHTLYHEIRGSPTAALLRMPLCFIRLKHFDNLLHDVPAQQKKTSLEVCQTLLPAREWGQGAGLIATMPS